MLHGRDFPGLAGPAVATATGAATANARGEASRVSARFFAGTLGEEWGSGVDRPCLFVVLTIVVIKPSLSLYSSRAFAHATSSSSLGSFSLTEFCSIPLLAYSPATNPQLPRDAFPYVV